MSGAFDLADDAAYAAWRSRKLGEHPRTLEELIVEVGDPRELTAAQRRAIVERCARANMAIYAGRTGSDPDKEIPRRLGRQLGLLTLDGNYLADDDGISPIAVAEEGTRTVFIPYTTRPIKWHTDGYYNPPDRRIRGMVLHCVQSAHEGGGNQLMDHEICYILLRDRDPEHIRALMAPDAMTIPLREEEGAVARGDRSGPVFSVDEDGCLHMRYTARTRSIAWKDDAATRAAVEALGAVLASDCPYIFRGRLEPGMGLVCNNVLHDRQAFANSAQRKRLIYRARYYERVSGS